MTEIVNLSISQSAASELSRQASFGGSPGEMSIDLVEDKNCSEGWMHIKLRPGTCNGSPISRTEGVTLYADVKKFNLLKDLKFCLLYTSPSPRDRYISRMPSSA